MIYIFTQRDPFFTDEFLREFDKYEIAYHVYDLPNFRRGRTAGLKKAIILYGFVGFCKLLFLYFFKYRKTNLKNAKVIKNISNEEMLKIIQTLNPDDVLLSLSAPSRIPIERIDPKIIKLNFHCGKLPAYAGMMPIFWQLKNNEKAITITVHDLAQNIDTGEIIAEYEFSPIGSLFNVSQFAKKFSAEIFYSLLSDRTKINKTFKDVNSSVALRKFPSKHHVREFKKIRKLI